VPLGLVERKEKQRPQIDRSLDPSADRGSELYQVETTPIEHDDFLNLVGDRQTGEHIVILGEPGAGKTTLLTRVWQSLLDTNRETPIIVAWISLAAVKDLDLEAYLHHVWLKQICKSTEIDTYWQSFQTLLDDQRVWLLFDGADEMGGDGLTKIQTMLKPIWVKSTIRSIVTCRLNLWDASSQNVLKNDFQIFRTLDFKQDLVEAFIGKWFDDDPVAGKKLIAALDETGKERIKDLARNPLRLTLLCNIWRRGESLPDTQAGLYHKFVNYFYNWSKFPELAKLRGELDRLMGELAKYGINKPMLRFRFTETELRNQSIDPEYIEVLKTLGWLNCVGVDEHDDEVYAFFHPTFQEYFAACSIDDWDYFLPKQHEDRPVICESGENLYRVFEQEWRQPMLLWFGREDIKSELKEKFIDKLMNFREQEGGFYYYSAYCMAAIAVGEFKTSKYAEEIVQQIVQWAFGYFNTEKQRWISYLYPISSLARNTILFTLRGYAIYYLASTLQEYRVEKYHHEEYTIEYSSAYHSELKIIDTLLSIDKKNIVWMEYLLDLFDECDPDWHHEDNVWDNIYDCCTLIKKHAVGHSTAIRKLIENIQRSSSYWNSIKLTYVSKSLIAIAKDDLFAIAYLIKVLYESHDEESWRLASKILSEIVSNQNKAGKYLNKIVAEPYYKPKQRIYAAIVLANMEEGNLLAFSCLNDIANNTTDEDIKALAIEALGKIPSHLSLKLPLSQLKRELIDVYISSSRTPTLP
jgi:hypothetical protein